MEVVIEVKADSTAQKRLLKSLSSLLKSDGNFFFVRYSIFLLISEITLDEFNMLWEEPEVLTKFVQPYIPELNIPLLQVLEITNFSTFFFFDRKFSLTSTFFPLETPLSLRIHFLSIFDICLIFLVN